MKNLTTFLLMVCSLPLFSQLYYKTDQIQRCRYDDFYLLINHCNYEKLAEKIYENESLTLLLRNKNVILTVNISDDFFRTENGAPPSRNIEEAYQGLLSDLKSYRLYKSVSDENYKVVVYHDGSAYQFFMLRKLQEYFAYVKANTGFTTKEDIDRLIQDLVWRD